MSGWPSAIIRFACHIPLGIVGFGNLSSWKTLQKFPVLHHAPYNSNLMPAWQLGAGMVSKPLTYTHDPPLLTQ